MTDEDRLQSVQDKVARYLAELVGDYEVASNGSFTFRRGSAQVFVSCRLAGPDWTGVTISIAVLLGIAPSFELFRHVATRSTDFMFGRLTLQPSRILPDSLDLLFTHELLGDYLDREELNFAVSMMATAADLMDDELQHRFGGRPWHQDVG